MEEFLQQRCNIFCYPSLCKRRGRHEKCSVGGDEFINLKKGLYALNHSSLQISIVLRKKQLLKLMAKSIGTEQRKMIYELKY
jgi:hypothetical protein